ncbi:Hypothetical predicted protein [Mytilus galloprovincialis]|uniref:Tyr recombinase domain-containing protein n=1 Tax=Mytilus galloprovincialis TaxID=29158 RepID=A0A8B6DLE2_MYTGA|nr:Hypothetical predicted protein [Mytilus galloprovincialis]
MDPYSAVFNEYLDPLYLEDDYEVPQFDVQYAQPPINYYTFKPAKTPSPIKPNENKENEVDIAETETQPQTLQLQQIPDLNFIDDRFTTQISELPNCDFEKFLSDISEENLNVMADQNAKFHKRFVTNDENERYRSNRPTETCKPDSPFYLGVNRSDNAKHWYKNQPLGEKSLKNLMKQAVVKSNVEKNKKLINHSGRKTATTRLLDEGVPITSVQQHTGHKSAQSLTNYANNSLKNPQKMSSILSRNISSTNESTVSTAQPNCSNVQQTGPVLSCSKPCSTATNENETAVLPIQDKTFFKVQNNRQNVADNHDNMDSSNTCNNNFQLNMKNSSQMNYNQLFPAG